MQQTVQEKKVVNGVNVSDLFNTVEAIKGDKEIAKFNFRATNKWVDGASSRATIKDFDGAGQTFDRAEPFIVQNDEHPILLRKDTGANPIEYALAALSGCLTTSLVYHAAAQGIKFDSVESSYSGNVDLHGFLGLDENVRNGFEEIQISFKVTGDATPAQLQELVELAQKRSPVFDIVTNKVPVTVTLAT